MFSRSDIVGKAGHFLLDLDVGGRVFRFATADLAVTDKAGNTFQYQRGLRRPSVSPMELGGQDVSIGLVVHDGTDWAALEAQDVDLELASGTLRRYFEGQVLEDARLVLRGIATGVTYEAQEDPLELSLTRSVRNRSWSWPSAQMKVDGTTWPDSGNYSRDPKIDGQPYQVVIGHPGVTGATTAEAVYPALLVQESSTGGDNADLLLVAGHRIGATSLHVFDYSADPPEEDTAQVVTHQEDGLGRTCALVSLNGHSFTTGPAKGRKYYVGHDADTGGGLVSPRTGSVLRGAGDVLRYVYETFSDVQIDAARMDLEAQALNHIKIDAWINRPKNMVEWLQSSVLPLLPVSPITGERGLFYKAWNWNATGTDVIAHLNADLDHVKRVSRIQRAGFDILNEFSIQYRQDRVSGGYLAMAALSGDPSFIDQATEQTTSDTDSRVAGSHLCKVSQARFGVRRASPIATSVIWDQPSAMAVLQAQAGKHATAKRVVQYEAPTDWEWLPLGAAVKLTDSEVSLSGRLALLTDYTYGPETMLLELTLLDHPVHHSRNTT